MTTLCLVGVEFFKNVSENTRICHFETKKISFLGRAQPPGCATLTG